MIATKGKFVHGKFCQAPPLRQSQVLGATLMQWDIMIVDASKYLSSDDLTCQNRIVFVGLEW